jgi:hypothetical protein
MAQAVSLGLSPWRPGFVPGSFLLGFMVDKLALGQVFVRVLRWSSVNIIPPWFFILISSGGEQLACWWPQFNDVISPQDIRWMPVHSASFRTYCSKLSSSVWRVSDPLRPLLYTNKPWLFTVELVNLFLVYRFIYFTLTLKYRFYGRWF